MSKKIVIALDGFSSCGKSTTARHVAAVLHYAFVDSGAMYRAVALYFHRNEISLLDMNQVANALKEIEITFVFNPAKQSSDTYLNGENIENEIRMMFISDMVSQVSALPIVRHAMVALQQKMGEKKGIVMDGRDIGTVVFPQAELKIFMTADILIRVERRFKEMFIKNPNVTFDEVKHNLETRDYIDSNREVSPLRMATDAILLDNTLMTMEEQLDFALKLVANKL
jgi:cytidylate kinase